MSDPLAEALRALENARAAKGTAREAEADELAFQALAGAVVEIGGELAHRVLSRAREKPWPGEPIDPDSEEDAGADADRKALARFLFAFSDLFPSEGNVAHRAVGDLLGFSHGQKPQILRGAPVGRGHKPYMLWAAKAREQIVLSIVFGAASEEATETEFSDRVLPPDEEGRTPFAQWSENVRAEDKAVARSLGRRARDPSVEFTEEDFERIERWQKILNLRAEYLRDLATGKMSLDDCLKADRKDRPI